MIVYDIVRIVESTGVISYPPLRRTFVSQHRNEAAARDYCKMYNKCREADCYHYEVETHEEESPNRALLNK